MRTPVPCDLCGLDVDAQDARTWRRRSSYGRTAGVRASGAHGGSDIALRKWEDGWAHDRCIRDAQNGRSGQTSLI